MSDDVATLADTVISPSADTTTSTPADPSAAQPATVATDAATSDLATVDPDAQEIGRILLDSGVTKDRLNDILAAPKTLESIQYMLENDPAEFVKMVERNNPKAGEKLIESVADLYVNRYSESDGKGKGKDTAAPADKTVAALQERLNQIENERAQEKRNAATAVVRQRYQGRVDDMFNLKEVKALGLTNSESKAMRAALDVELGRDSAATQRILNGNFVDVPRVFKGIIDEWATDKRSAAEAAKTARDNAEKASFPEFTSGPNPLTGLPTDAFDSWDKTEEAFAKVLTRTK